MTVMPWLWTFSRVLARRGENQKATALWPGSSPKTSILADLGPLSLAHSKSNTILNHIFDSEVMAMLTGGLLNGFFYQRSGVSRGESVTAGLPLLVSPQHVFNVLSLSVNFQRESRSSPPPVILIVLSFS